MAASLVDLVPAAPTLDPEQARALVFPLYADRTLETGEPLSAHAQAMVEIVRAVRPEKDLLTAA